MRRLLGETSRRRPLDWLAPGVAHVRPTVSGQQPVPPVVPPRPNDEPDEDDPVPVSEPPMPIPIPRPQTPPMQVAEGSEITEAQAIRV